MRRHPGRCSCLLALFVLLPASPAAAQPILLWNNTSGGNWNVPGNWTPAGPPTATDQAQIDIAGTYTVTLNDTRSITNLTLNNATATVAHQSGSVLNVSGTIALTAGNYVMTGGLISGGSITSAGGTLQPGSSTANRLNNVAVGSGVINFNAFAGVLRLQGNSTITGTVDLNAGSSSLIFEQSAVLTGVTLNLAASGTQVAVDGNSTFTFAPSTTMTHSSTSSSGLTSDVIVSGTQVFQNQGLIRNTGSGTLTLSVEGFVNQSGGIVRSTAGTVLLTRGGTINQAGGLFDVNGGTFTLGGANWVNAGTIAVSSGILNLGGSYTTAALGTLNRTGGTVNITGALNNASATLALNADTGTFVLAGGSITGGSITAAGGAVLTANGASTNLINNVNLGLNVLDFTPGAARLSLRGSTTLTPGTVITLAGGNNVLAFDQTVTLNNITLSTTNTGGIIAIDGTNTVTLDTTSAIIDISSGGNNIMGLGFPNNPTGTGTLVNNGLIHKAQGSTIFTVRPDVLTNNGTLQSSAGRLRVFDTGVNFTNFNSATNTLTGGTYRVLPGGEIELTNKSVANLGAGTTVELNGAVSPFNALNALTTNHGTLLVRGGRTFAPAGAALANTGVLEVGVSSTVTASLIINGGGVLRGSGTIAGNVTYDTTGGSLIPGLSPGILTITGDLITNSSTTYLMEFDGPVAGTSHDQLIVNGDVTIGDAFLSATLNFAPNASDRLFLLSKTSAGPITGIFSGLADGSTFSLSGYSATISYFGDVNTQATSGGNDVVLYNFVAVPEVNTFVALGLLLLGGGYTIVRRHTRNQAKADQPLDQEQDGDSVTSELLA